jgi:hypothetical protein
MKDRKMMTRKNLNAMLEKARIIVDRVSLKQDGTIELRRSYFYRHGSTAESVADRLAQSLPELRLIEARDEWRAWPKTSYFVAVFAPRA